MLFSGCAFLRATCFAHTAVCSQKVNQARVVDFLQFLPANDSNNRIGVHVQSHGAETHSQFACHALRRRGLLRRCARSVHICFS